MTSMQTPQTPFAEGTRTRQGSKNVPVTLDDLRHIEESLFQSPKSRFTTNQRLFFEALLSDPNMDVGAAASITGTNIATARQWLARGDCQQALNHLLTQRLTRLGIDKDSLLLRIVDCLEMAMGDKPIKRVAYDSKLSSFVTQELEETDLAAAARFTDQLGKHFKLFGDDSNRAVSVSINFDFGQGPQPYAQVVENKPTHQNYQLIEHEEQEESEQPPVPADAGLSDKDEGEDGYDFLK